MTRVFALLWIGWAVYFGIVEGLTFILRRTDLTLSDFTWLVYLGNVSRFLRLVVALVTVEAL